MKRTTKIRLVSALGFALMTLAASSTMPAGSAASASASASASAAAREPPPEPIEAQSIPTTPSKAPTLQEWKAATPIEFTARSSESRACTAYRVREWLKVHCDAMIARIRQFGGSPEGVALWISPRGEMWRWDQANGGELILPMRPGDRRILQFFQLWPEMCFGSTSSPWVILDEAWIEGDKTPTLILR